MTRRAAPPRAGEPSPPELLGLHAVRILGAPSATSAAALFGLDIDWMREFLLDAEAIGEVRRTRWEGDERWSLTGRGKAANETMLAAELDRVGARSLMEWALEGFEAVNGRFTAVCTAWQLADPADRGNATRELRELSYCGARLQELSQQVCMPLPRFGVHLRRYDAALLRVRAGATDWIDSPALPSLHAVWMSVHEDLLATLGRPRGWRPSP